eukprot:6318422-Pyramimonas_sp.AAC.1
MGRYRSGAWGSKQGGWNVRPPATCFIQGGVQEGFRRGSGGVREGFRRGSGCHLLHLPLPVLLVEEGAQQHLELLKDVSVVHVHIREHGALACRAGPGIPRSVTSETS